MTVDDEQLAWFEDVVSSHKAEDGWKIFVFTHAPPIGSGLRVLQNNHVVNGCCWLNHSGGATTRKFIELVRKHRCIKAWFSGHFHLGQDYQDSITFPSVDPSEGPYPNRGSCVFAQTAVMRGGVAALALLLLVALCVALAITAPLLCSRCPLCLLSSAALATSASLSSARVAAPRSPPTLSSSARRLCLAWPRVTPCPPTECWAASTSDTAPPDNPRPRTTPARLSGPGPCSRHSWTRG